MAYNEAFTKMVADGQPVLLLSIPALIDNITKHISAPVLSGGAYRAQGDLNEILQVLVNNDAALKDMAASAADAIKKSSAIDSDSEETVATSRAIKLVNIKCPHRVGDIFITTLADNPAVSWPGTTWEFISNRFLFSTADEVAGTLGGSKKISEAQMPIHKHTATQASHYHTQAAHRHLMFANAKTGSVGQTANITASAQVAATAFSSNVDESYSLSSSTAEATLGRSNAYAGNTGSSAPTVTVGYAGGSEDYMPLYYAVKAWKRLK